MTTKQDLMNYVLKSKQSFNGNIFGPMLDEYAAQSGGSGGGAGGAQSDWNQNDATAADYIKNRPFYSEMITYAVDPTTPIEDFETFEVVEALYKISDTPLTLEEIQKIKPSELFISNGTSYEQLASDDVEWIVDDLTDLGLAIMTSFYYEDDNGYLNVQCLSILAAGTVEGITITEDMIGLYFANIVYDEEANDGDGEEVYSPIYKYQFEKINKIDMKYLPIEENNFKIYNNPYFTSWKQLVRTANYAYQSGEDDTLFNLGDIFDTNYGRVRIIDKKFNSSNNEVILGFAFLDAVIEGEFDAGYEDVEEDRGYYDNNYETSQIRAFLNAEGEDWYDEDAEYAKIGDYQKDKPTYVNRPGFLTNLNKELKDWLIETEIPCFGFIYGPDGDKIYKVGDKVVTNNKIYTCVTSCKGSYTWDDISANFEEGDAVIPYYSSETYSVGNKVYNEGSIWTCTTAGEFNTDNFERDTSFDSTLTDKVFLLSAAEVNAYGGGMYSNALEGTPLPYYAELSDELTNDYKTGRICFSGDEPNYYWLRSARPNGARNAYGVTRYGSVDYRDVDGSDGGVCPALYVNFYEK